MTGSEPYSYRKTVKSDKSDELVNTFLVRPIAGQIVRLLYRSSVTPNQVTIAALITGLASAAAYAVGQPAMTIVGGCLLWLKDILDSADGQLARAKGTYSRAGRFLDSIGDLIVNAAVFAAISAVLAHQVGSSWLIVGGIACFAGTTLRISYHVFYQVSSLHLENTYAMNRTDEEVREEDLLGSPLEIRLQKLYQLFYGWQDRWMAHLDAWCRHHLPDARLKDWYSDGTALRISGFMGMGTELFVLALLSVLNALEFYLGVNLLVQNGIWIGCVVYRRVILAGRLRAEVR